MSKLSIDQLKQRISVARKKGPMHAVAIWPDEADDLVRQLEAMPRWVDVDLLPDADIQVMVETREGEVLPAFFDGDCWRDLTAVPLAEHSVVRWMEYPAPMAEVLES